MTASPDELAEARRWTSTVFAGAPAPAALRPGLEVVANYDLIQKNARFGKPLNLAGAKSTHGLFCHATSKIVVRLPAAAARFEALVGVDRNEQTSGGRGSVVFGVKVGEREAFRSGVQREGMPPLPVAVDLAGATEFTLEVGDGADGISCDQADWAEARVTLADGRDLWLADLPTAGGPALPDAALPPFSFVYDGKPSAQILPNWRQERSTRELDPQRTEYTLTYTDPQTSLSVRLVGVEYRDFPTVEWTLHLRNAGPQPTPIIESIQALDARFARGHYGEFLLHHAVGSPCAPNDYAPLETPLTPGLEKRIGAAGGRPTNSDLSYFNLEVPTGHGVIIVVGWPGQWASLWTRDGETGLRVQAGQELTHFRLQPGEEVRSALIVLQFWTGDWLRAQNLWRSWMLAHNVPRPGGKLPQPELFGCSSHLFNEMVDANEENQKACIDRYLAERLPIDRWWMDAGWYPCAPVGWPKTGTWEVDRQRFPNGLRAISDHAHAKGVKTILWFEPERVHADTWLANEHPEWVLGGRAGGLLDLGNPAARTWLTDRVDQLLTAEGIDLYRQDFNMDPLPYWRAADAPDRQGLTEIRHVEGYLAYWDELQRRHPDMLIDSCASGGRRNDLETLRRAIPLWRTDWRCEPIGTQSCGYGIALWIPLSGTGAAEVDTYLFRSNMAPFTNALFDVRNPQLDYDLLRKLVGQWRRVAGAYLGDFYPITSYSLSKDAWIAWQFDRPETGEGMVQAFRREKSIFEAGRLKLQGLDPTARYAVTDLDTDRTQSVTGRQLMEEGLLVAINDLPGSALLAYARIAAGP
jgi:alpha-galactosidase